MILKLSSNLVIGENTDLDEFIVEKFTYDLNGVILDLNNTRYIDSSGLSVILKIRKFLKNISKVFFIISNDKKIEKVFKVSRIDHIIPLCRDFNHVLEILHDQHNIEKGSFDIKEYKLVIPSEFSYIKVAQDFIENIVKKNYEYTKTDEYDIKMCVEESLANAIEHGYKDHELEGLIQIFIICQESEIIIFIDDYGKGYDKQGIIDRVNKSINEPFSTRGRGFLILGGISDDLHFDSMQNKVSSIIIVKKLNMKE